MTWHNNFAKWETFKLEEELRDQLLKLSNNKNLLEDSFYKHLEFGTGGMLGKLGSGTNRLNIYTIRRAGEGLARYILEQGEKAKQRGVVIAYDSRHKSPEFALEVVKPLENMELRLMYLMNFVRHRYYLLQLDI